MSTFADMFIRRRKNKSGSTSVTVVDKSSGKFKELTTIGVSSDPKELDEFERKGRLWIDQRTGQLSLDFDETEKAMEAVWETISRIERTLNNTP